MADTVVFDVKPPFQTKGAEVWRQTWAACGPYLPASFSVERRDLAVSVSGDMSMAHWIWRIVVVPHDERSAKTWIRTTACYRRIQGVWRIVHEHCSIPFDPMTSQVVFTLDP